MSFRVDVLETANNHRTEKGACHCAGEVEGDGRDSVRFHGYDFRGDVQDKDIKVKCDNGSRIECFRRCSQMHNSKARKGQLDPSWIMR